MSDIRIFMNFFHVLNRGVDKRRVFMEEIDYVRFIHDMYEFNDIEPTNDMNSYRFHQYSDVGHPNIGGNKKRVERQKRKLLVKIHSFTLMPNHYHLLLSPVVENGIPLFMKKLNAGYTKYFNNKNDRVGALWQGGYKSVPITTDAHFNFILFYIHFNPLDLHAPEWRKQCPANPQRALMFLEKYRWSSHRDYLGLQNFSSVSERSFFLDIFNGEQGYKKTVTRELKAFKTEKEVSLE